MSHFENEAVPVTVFTGFLGSGKTTIILDLLKRLHGYKVVVLKNEFGDSKIDSQLASTSALAVKELINGCLCCVLVGQLKIALLEILEMKPDRIIVETSGSAFPAPIAWQIRELREFKLDSIITVIDAENFSGYEDTSYTAKMQAQYTDLILINKHEHVSERLLDLCLDKVNTLNLDTPKIKYSPNLSIDLFFGLDTKLFENHQGSVGDKYHHDNEIDLIQFTGGHCDIDKLKKFLDTLPKDQVYRVKGVFPIDDHSSIILNWAYGRSQWHDIAQGNELKLTVMGIDLFFLKNKFVEMLPDSTFQFHSRQ